MTSQYLPPFWTEDKIAALKERLDQGEPYSAIARALGAKSRNAVIGKAHRLELFRLAHRKRNNGATMTAVNPGKLAPRFNRKLPDKPKPPAPEDPSPGQGQFDHPVTLMGLTERTCRWPGPGETDGPNTLYCGNPVERGSSYCPIHARLAYAKHPRKP